MTGARVECTRQREGDGQGGIPRNTLGRDIRLRFFPHGRTRLQLDCRGFGEGRGKLCLSLILGHLQLFRLGVLSAVVVACSVLSRSDCFHWYEEMLSCAEEKFRNFWIFKS